MTEIHGMVAAGFESVRAAFAANFARGAEVGAAVAVYRHGRPVVDLWAGTADPASGRPWHRDTLQVIFSATKSATAACAHLLAERGQLDLDAPVAAYWPEFAAAGKDRIPVRWLLSHQAGVPALDRPLPVADALAWEPMVAALAAQAPAWEPGTAHGYHGMTYGWLVGEVVRRVSGRSLGAYFAEEIAGPLGLDFWIGLPKSEQHRVSRLVPAPVPAGPPLDPASLFVRSIFVTTEPLDLDDPDTLAAEIPAVNGVCTARSLARFYAGLIGAVDGVRLLDPATLAAATAEQASGVDRVLGVPTRPALGFGLPLPDMPWWSPSAFGFPGHGGSLGYADPATGIAFGYVPNRLHVDLAPDPRASALIAALP
ncbi:serine hydrolase domain-containing protein [Actinomycetes bacterium KLBMP 9797]